MNWISNLCRHPASMLVIVALIVLVRRLATRFLPQRSRAGGQASAFGAWTEYIMYFFSGVLLTNGLANFYPWDLG